MKWNPLKCHPKPFKVHRGLKSKRQYARQFSHLNSALLRQNSYEHATFTKRKCGAHLLGKELRYQAILEQRQFLVDSLVSAGGNTAIGSHFQMTHGNLETGEKVSAGRKNPWPIKAHYNEVGVGGGKRTTFEQ